LAHNIVKAILDLVENAINTSMQPTEAASMHLLELQATPLRFPVNITSSSLFLL
ncbi:hypothetical protein KXX35_009899, partial [Aspergillus fumigatus]